MSKLKLSSTNPYGLKRRLIGSITAITVDPNEELIFDIHDDILDYQTKIHFVFVSEGKELSAKLDIKNTDNIFITLHKWDGPSPVENTEPIELVFSKVDNENTIDIEKGSKIWIKFSTFTTNKAGRTFSLSVWTEDQNG